MTSIWFVEESGTTSEIVAMPYPPANYIVTRSDDALVFGTDRPMFGTLRSAIQHSDMTPGPNTITFNIPGSGPHTINLSGEPLPAITSPVTIDGGTLGLIIINGENVLYFGGPTGSGLELDTDDNIVENLEITGFPGNGITMDSAGNTIQNDVISGNVWAGSVEGPGSFPGTGVAGIMIGGAGASGNLVQGNLIVGNGGTLNAEGAYGKNGVSLSDGASNNTVGGTTAGSANVDLGESGLGHPP